MEKILLIGASPRGERSNSLMLADAFLEGVTAAVPSELRRAELTEKRIEPCRGCFSCWGATPGRCVIRDDMQGLLDEILWADDIIVSFPIYYFGLPGPLKTMLDRTLPLVLPYDGRLQGLHRPRYDFSGKRFILVSSCGYGTTDRIYDALREEASMIFAHGCTQIFVPQGEVLQLPQLAGLRRRYLGRLTEAGREFAAARSLSDETAAALSRPFLPQRAFEKIVEAHWARFPGAMGDQEK